MHRNTFVFAALVGVVATLGCAGETDGAAEQASAAATMTASAPSCYATVPMEEAHGRQSPLSRVEFTYAGGQGLLCYGAPSARERAVMGSLVPWSAPWRAGANEATAIHLTAPASIGGVALEPGSYSIYAVPGQEEWQFFVNSNHARWGIPIDDAVRSTEVGSFTAAAEPTDTMVETLTYRYEPNAENTMGDMVMEWENTRVRFQVRPGGM